MIRLGLVHAGATTVACYKLLPLNLALIAFRPTGFNVQYFANASSDTNGRAISTTAKTNQLLVEVPNTTAKVGINAPIKGNNHFDKVVYSYWKKHFSQYIRFEKDSILTFTDFSLHCGHILFMAF